jgi:hypothetical protein
MTTGLHRYATTPASRYPADNFGASIASRPLGRTSCSPPGRDNHVLHSVPSDRNNHTLHRVQRRDDPLQGQHEHFSVCVIPHSNYSVLPLPNGISDHEGQLLTINLPSILMREQQIITYRKINKLAAADFQNHISYENWDETFGSNNYNLIFNSFLNTYLRIFNSCFQIVNKHRMTKSGNFSWITLGIRVSCNHEKKKLYLRIKMKIIHY